MAAEYSRSVPEGWEAAVDRYGRKYSLSRDMALKVYDSGLDDSFEKLVRSLWVEPSVIASVLVDVPARLSREGIPEEYLSEEVLGEVLGEVAAGRLAKEAIPDVLRMMGTKRLRVSQAISSLGLTAMSEEEIGREVKEVVALNRRLIEDRGSDAFSPLMGELMKRLRGRADGAIVGLMLRNELDQAAKTRTKKK
jgi:glutamyl-tRNA(Gln) amidotransferase subunit E